MSNTLGTPTPDPKTPAIYLNSIFPSLTSQQQQKIENFCTFLFKIVNETKYKVNT